MAMRRVPVLAAITLFHAIASADTRIIEYADHYYVESNGTAAGRPEAAPDASVQTPGRRSAPPADPARDASAPPASVNAGQTPPSRNGKPAYSEEEAAALRPDLAAELERLENERAQLLDFDVAAHPDEVNSRRQQAIEIIQQINRVSADFKQYYQQYQEQKQQNR